MLAAVPRWCRGDLGDGTSCRCARQAGCLAYAAVETQSLALEDDFLNRNGPFLASKCPTSIGFKEAK